MSNRTQKLPLVGGLLAAIGASICCAGPLLLLLMGISGSWISTLTWFEPFRPWFIGLVAIAFGWAGWQLYKPGAICEEGKTCANPAVIKRQKTLFWLVLAVSLVMVTSNYWLLWLMS